MIPKKKHHFYNRGKGIDEYSGLQSLYKLVLDSPDPLSNISPHSSSMHGHGKSYYDVGGDSESAYFANSSSETSSDRPLSSCTYEDNVSVERPWAAANNVGASKKKMQQKFGDCDSNYFSGSFSESSSYRSPSLCVSEDGDSQDTPCAAADEDGNSKKKRQQKCSFCANHNAIKPVKGHKWLCDFRSCSCEKCEITRNRQYYMKEQQRITRHQQSRQLQQQMQSHSFYPGESTSTAYHQPIEHHQNTPLNYPRAEELEKETADILNPILFDRINEMCRPKSHRN